MRDSNVKRLSALHGAVYHMTGGRIGRRLVHNDMLLLTTIGRITGTKHRVPLLYLREGEDYVVIASFGGRPQHPDWYLNLVVEPHATAQILNETRPVRGATFAPEERRTWWPRIVNAYSDYDLYQSRTEREIPIVRLEAV